MTQLVIDCGPLTLVWIPNLAAPVSTRSQSGAFEMRCGTERIGSVSLVGTHPPHAVIGYEVIPEFRSRGLASIAVAAVLAVAPSFGFNVLTAQCRSNNAHSRRVLEKTGFTLSTAAPFWTNTGRSTKKRDMSLLFMVYQWIAVPILPLTEHIASAERHMK